MDREDLWELITGLLAWGGLIAVCFMAFVIGG